MGFFESVMGLISKAVEVGKKVYNLFKLNKQSIPKEGKKLDDEIQSMKEQIAKNVESTERFQSEILRKMNLITGILEVNPRAAKELIQRPEEWGVIDIQYLRDVKSMAYYTPSGILLPIIIPDMNENNIIGLVPTPVIRANFVHLWEMPLDLTRLSEFGITSTEIMPEVTKWFYMLSKEDQIYFSQLYKDYFQLAKFIKQSDIPTPTEFVHELFTYREKVTRETGAKTVMFNVSTKNKRVRIQPKAVK